MLSPKLGNPTPCPKYLGEKNYRPVILRMSKESGMLNSMTESSFSLLFSRSSSSWNRDTQLRGAAAQPGTHLQGSRRRQSSPRKGAHVPFRPASPCAGSRPGGSRSCRAGSPGCSRSAPPPSHHSPAERRGRRTVRRATPISHTASPRAAVPAPAPRLRLEPLLVPEAAATAVHRAKAARSDLPASGKRSLPWVSTLKTWL